MGNKSSSSERFLLLDNLIEGCQIVDANWKYVYLNDSAIVHANKTRDELIGVRMMDAYPGIDETELFSVIKQVMETGESTEMDNHFVYPDGSQGWFHLHIQTCPEGVLILSDDVTERRLSRKSLETQLKRLDALRQIDLAIVSSADLAVLSSAVLDQVVQVLDVDAAIIQLVDPDSLILRPLSSRGMRTAQGAGLRLRVGQGIVGRVALEQKTISIQNLPNEVGFRRKELAEREGFISYFATPLVSTGRVIGVLELFNRQEMQADLSWLEFFEILAGQVAIAISHVRNVTDLHQAHVQLSLAYDHTIEGWAKTLELRDIETEGHSQRVTELADDLASRLGYEEKDLVHIRRGAMLHDIGKIGIPDEILFKPAKLTPNEMAIMQRHPTIAYDLLSQVEFLKPALVIPRYHHEKWDGSGYPTGLRQEQIPEPARIFALVDVWDALLSDRPYRKKWSGEKARAYINSEAGAHFDPQITKVFVKEII